MDTLERGGGKEGGEQKGEGAACFAKLADTVLGTGACCSRELGVFFNSEVTSLANFFPHSHSLFPEGLRNTITHNTSP